jgi:stage II sporulation protein D
MQARIGFLHARRSILLSLPPGTTIEAASALSVDKATSLLIRLDEQKPALAQACLKVVESDSPSFLQTVQSHLLLEGVPSKVLPFAPGGLWEGAHSPKTELLVVPVSSKLKSRRQVSHMERDLGKPEHAVIFRNLLSALETLEESSESSAALWHTDAVAIFTRILQKSESRFSIHTLCHECVETGHDGGLWTKTPTQGGSLSHLATQATAAPLEHSLAENLHSLRILLPPGESASVQGVEVGIGFHWNHKASLSYAGALEVFLDSAGCLGLLNELALEDYLAAVNSSEMTADSPDALLEAQSICARSTFLATRGRHHAGEAFDLCADDHCQCFRGSGMIEKKSLAAAQSTSGEVLTFFVDSLEARGEPTSAPVSSSAQELVLPSGSKAMQNQICDARYSKSCGGLMEAYEQVWEPRRITYLGSGSDLIGPQAATTEQPQLGASEAEWKAWIDRDEEVWCNTDRHAPPAGLASCEGRYRWVLDYEREQLRGIIAKKAGLPIRSLTGFKVLKRGASGRLVALKICSQEGDFTIGRELVIRLALSEDCLYSAAIYFEDLGDTIRIHGKGWGHGVGMCQLGATQMALTGSPSEAILAHYFRGTQLQILGKQKDEHDLR